MTHRDHRFILVPGNEAGQGTAGTNQEPSPALAATGELVEGMGCRRHVRTGVTRLPFIVRQPIGGGAAMAVGAGVALWKLETALLLDMDEAP